MKKSSLPVNMLKLGVTCVALSACNDAPSAKSLETDGIAHPWKSETPNVRPSEVFYARPLKSGFLAGQPQTSASNSWGPIEIDMSNGGDQPRDGRTISIGGTTYNHGLGVHGQSSIVYEPSGGCSSFQAVVGLDDEIRNQSQYGSVVFQVWADGAKLWESGLLKVTGTPTSETVNLPITGKSTLELRVTDGGDGIVYDHADWADARVECAASATINYLSDLAAVSKTNGFGPVELNMSNGGDQPKDGRPLTLAGVKYDKGLGVHAASAVVYDLAGKCSSFKAVVGLDDEIRSQTQSGSVRFEVIADGNRLFDSGVMNNNDSLKAQNVNVAVTGASKLELRVTDGGDGSAYDHADWAGARVECAGVLSPAPTPQPPPAPPAPPPASSLPYSRGVNLAGADFGQDVLPGTFGKEYTYPNQAEVDYFSAKGMTIYRLPFLWERLQRRLNADFDAAELARLDEFVNATTAKGKIVILDPHNYARYSGALIGSSGVPDVAFADFWRRLALRFKSNPKLVFGLMNEPHNMPTAQWVSAANAAIAAIRATGATNTIFVPGNRWTGAWTWYSQDGDGASNAEALLSISDPGNNTVFEVHQYLDRYASGTEDPCVSATIGSERLRAFTGWLRDHNRKGFLGEFSSGANTTCDAALADMLRYVEGNKDVWNGWTYWAAGPWWPEGSSLEPKNNKDARQMPILQQFLTPAK